MRNLQNNPVLRGLAVFVLAIGLLSQTGASAQTKLKVAYIPIMPMAQLFVMEGEGWTKEAGLELELTKFSSGPAIVQAIASGDFDVMYFGIGPAMVSRARGVPLKVVASAGIEQIAVITRGDFGATMAAAATPAEGVRKFTADTGRKPRIASLPKGSVPDTVLRHWLIKVAGVDRRRCRDRRYGCRQSAAGHAGQIRRCRLDPRAHPDHHQRKITRCPDCCHRRRNASQTARRGSRRP